MIMKSSKASMKVEYSQLNLRCQSLNYLINSTSFNEIDDEEKALLKIQYKYMTEYLSILGKRCRMHNININI